MMNMNKLKPSYYEVYPVYTCPNCGAEWQQSIEETVFPAGILCFCDEQLHLETIEDVKVNASFSSVKTNPPKPDDDVFNTVVSALIGLGYKKSEAVNMFNDNFDESTSAEDIIIRILS